MVKLFWIAEECERNNEDSGNNNTIMCVVCHTVFIDDHAESVWKARYDTFLRPALRSQGTS